MSKELIRLADSATPLWESLLAITIEVFVLHGWVI
jgi:hypothetical protein